MPNSRGRSEFLNDIQKFRGFSIIFIVVGHCLSGFDWSDSPNLELVLKRFFANGTIFFIFISGYLFEHLSVRYRPFEYFKSKLNFVLLPYVFISALPVAGIIWVGSRAGLDADFFEQPYWQQAVDLMLTGGHVTPFWFIPTLGIFFLASPLLHAFFKIKLSYCVLPVLLIFSILVPRGNHQPVQSFIHFLSVWVAGMACCRFRWRLNYWYKIYYLLGYLSLAIISILDIFHAHGSHGPLSLLGKLLMCMLLLNLMRRQYNFEVGYLAQIGALSFGVFFIHSFVISTIKLLFLRIYENYPDGSVFGVIFLVVLTCIISAAIIKLFKLLFGANSRYLVGV